MAVSLVVQAHVSSPDGLPQYDDPRMPEYDMAAGRISPQTSRAVRKTKSTMAEAFAG